MSTAVISLMFMVLLTVILAHLAWSFGFTWPLRDEKLLAQAVVGTAGIEGMPPRFLTFGVTVALTAALLVAVAMGTPESGGPLLTIAGWGFALLFLARGIVGYTPWWARQTPEPIFRWNDLRIYSPICLFVGAGFVALALMRV